MTSPLFYQNVVPLNRDQHRALKLRALDNYAFSAQTALIPLLTHEFVQAAREFPIAFVRGQDQNLVPVVVTGVPSGKNVYVDEAGQWQARYVPAYVRRYPFIFAETGPDQLTVCFDQSCEALNESEGTPLFNEADEAGPALEPVLAWLTEYQRQAVFTAAFMKRLDVSGLLMEANAKADLTDGRSMALAGFWIVDEARLKDLSEDTLKDWLARGELGLIYAHLLSLGNFLQLLERQPQSTPVSVPCSVGVESTEEISNRQQDKRSTNA